MSSQAVDQAQDSAHSQLYDSSKEPSFKDAPGTMGDTNTNDNSNSNHNSNNNNNNNNSSNNSNDDDDNLEKYPQNLVADVEAGGGGHALRRTATGGSVQSRDSQDRLSRVLSETSPTIHNKDQTSPLPKMGGGRDYPPDLPDRDPWRVDFDGPDDPLSSMNWPVRQKILTCVILGFSTLCTAWCSSVFAPASTMVMEEFHMGQVTVTLGVSLYVLGFATGPIVFAPLSELYGRKLPLVISMFGLTCFTAAVGAAKDFQTIMLGRFFAGCTGSAPLAVVAAAFADMFNNKQRGTSMVIFAAMVFTAPILAPVIGAFIVNNPNMNWRWTMYITCMMSGLALALTVFFYEETYAPILLARKATELRRRTGNWGIYAPHESVELDLNDIVTRNLTRPIRLLFTEPIIFLITLYTAFIYGILYLLLESYPIIFGPGGYNFKPNLIQLPYLSLAVGMILAGFMIVYVFEPMHNKRLAANGGKPVPEARLPPMISGAIVFPIGIFWLTWTGNYPEHVHWAAPTVAGIFIGYGLLSIFLPSMNYIIDAYLMFAASALAGNTFLRSSFGAAFPLFANAMFKNLGTNWAGTLLGCLGVLLMPVPVLFHFFGKRIRKSSKFAFDLE